MFIYIMHGGRSVYVHMCTFHSLSSLSGWLVSVYAHSSLLLLHSYRFLQQALKKHVWTELGEKPQRIKQGSSLASISDHSYHSVAVFFPFFFSVNDPQQMNFPREEQTGTTASTVHQSKPVSSSPEDGAKKFKMAGHQRQASGIDQRSLVPLS